jgi:hypothetical protein
MVRHVFWRMRSSIHQNIYHTARARIRAPHLGLTHAPSRWLCAIGGNNSTLKQVDDELNVRTNFGAFWSSQVEIIA